MSTYLFKSQIANATNNFSVLFSTDLAFMEMHRRLSSLLKPQYFEVIKVPPTPEAEEQHSLCDVQNLLASYRFLGKREKSYTKEDSYMMKFWDLEPQNNTIIATMRSADFAMGKTDEDEVFQELAAYEEISNACTALKLKPFWSNNSRAVIILKGESSDTLTVNRRCSGYHEIVKTSVHHTSEYDVYEILKK